MEQNIIQRKSESNKYNFTNVIQDEKKKKWNGFFRFKTNIIQLQYFSTLSNS